MEKKQFNWIVVVLLNYVTCGIYAIYMWYVMAKENNEVAAKFGIGQIQNYIVAYLLGMVTCGIYPIYWMYKFAEQQVAISRASGVNSAPTDNVLVMLLIYFVPFYGFYVLCDNYNRTVAVN